MSREPSPELLAAAEKLFSACRSEQHSPQLERRIAALASSGAARSSLRPARQRAGTGPLRWLLAAVVLASLGAAALWLSRAEAPRIAISAEQRPAPSAPEAPPVASSSAPRALEREATTPIGPAPIKPTARPKPPVPAPSAAPSTPPAPEPEAAPPKHSLGQDLQELMRIRSTLRAGDGAEALELLDQRASAGGELEAEATLLRIEALASVGRLDEASELAQRFVLANPNSALADRAKAFIR
jgi:hypothetical protein